MLNNFSVTSTRGFGEPGKPRLPRAPCLSATVTRQGSPQRLGEEEVDVAVITVLYYCFCVRISNCLRSIS